MSSSGASRTLETATLFGIAVDAARGIKAAPRTGGQRPALISVVFSVIALEAFINEMTDYAQDMTAYQPSVEGPEAVLFAQVMGDAEEAHARLESKFTLASWILSGRNIDRGGQPYQDFALLMRLRNDLVHTKPNKLFVHGVTTNEEAHGSLLARFRDKNILADDNVTGSWTYLAQTKAVAEWSCKTAAHVVNDMCSGVPQISFQTVLDFVNKAFQSHIATL
jgi:hypothetical protein